MVHKVKELTISNPKLDLRDILKLAFKKGNNDFQEGFNSICIEKARGKFKDISHFLKKSDKEQLEFLQKFCKIRQDLSGSEDLMKEIVPDFTTDLKEEGRWITVRGKHIFIQKGQKLRFKKDGKFEILSKGESKKKKERLTKKQLVREKIEKTGLDPERAKKEVEKTTPKQRVQTKVKQEIEQERRRKEAGFRKGEKVKFTPEERKKVKEKKELKKQKHERLQKKEKRLGVEEKQKQEGSIRKLKEAQSNLKGLAKREPSIADKVFPLKMPFTCFQYIDHFCLWKCFLNWSPNWFNLRIQFNYLNSSFIYGSNKPIPINSNYSFFNSFERGSPFLQQTGYFIRFQTEDRFLKSIGNKHCSQRTDKYQQGNKIKDFLLVLGDNSIDIFQQITHRNDTDDFSLLIKDWNFSPY